MLHTSAELPEVEPRDPEPVAVAIETARALYRTGDHLDALRWLRRAAERAEESGDDLRAVHLARSAADLSTALQTLPPPVPGPPPAPLPIPAPAARRPDEAVALSPYDDFSDKTIVDAASPPAARDLQRSGVQITELPTPASSDGPRSRTLPSPSSSDPNPAGAEPLPPAFAVKQSSLPAFRVALTLDPESPGTWQVRLLSASDRVPQGCEEALLVALDPKTRLGQ